VSRSLTGFRLARPALRVLLPALAGLASCGLLGVSAFTRTGDDISPRFFHRASRLASGLVMVTGGLGLQVSPPSLVSLAGVSFFDPVSGAFSPGFSPEAGGPRTTPSLGLARCCHTQTTLPDGRVLIAGGRIGASQMPGPGMAAARSEHTASLLPDGRVVVAGGTTWQVYDPAANAWSADRPLARTRVAHAAVALPDVAGPGRHHVLIIAGAGSGPRTLERLDPDAGTSTLSNAALSTGVDDLAAVRLDDGTVLVLGGQDVLTGGTVGLAYRYHPALDLLAALPSPPNAPAGLADHQMVALGRHAVTFGGEQEVASQDSELRGVAVFDRSAADWVATATTLHAHDDFPAVGLADGRVLLIGGGAPFLGQEVPTAASEVFDLSALLPGG
jgi:hypothetical protein